MKATLSKPKKEVVVSVGQYRLEAVVVSNPDHYQFFTPIKLSMQAPTLKALRNMQIDLVDNSHRGIGFEIPIGGGNWSYKSFVFGPDGKIIGRMSYNGRVWDKEDKEIL